MGGRKAARHDQTFMCRIGRKAVAEDLVWVRTAGLETGTMVASRALGPDRAVSAKARTGGKLGG